MMTERPQPAEDTYETAEVRRAARALLRQPMILSGGSQHEDFRLVRRHRQRLTRIFAEALGYRLVVDTRTARLFKAGLGRDSTRPLRRRNDTAFSPRSYAILCILIAALTRSKTQLLIDELVAHVRSAAADSGVRIDLDRITDRRALHAGLTALIGLGILHERDSDGGGVGRWAEDANARALLDVDRDRLQLLVSAPLASTESVDDLLNDMALPSAAGGARMSVRRQLVESPVLSARDLTSEQADWWGKNRNRERERLLDLFGLGVELRAEGAIAIDPQEELSDIDFPGVGATKKFALLVLEDLVDDARAHHVGGDRSWTMLGERRVRSAFDNVIAAYGTALTKQYRSDADALRRDVFALLRAMGLVLAGPDGGWEIHAAAARYVPRPEVVTQDQASLFDVDTTQESSP